MRGVNIVAKLLYKLGLFSTRHPKSIIAGLLAILIAVGVMAGVLGPQLKDDMTIPGTPAQDTIDMLKEEFPEVGDAGAQMQIIVKAPEGKTLVDEDVKTSLASLAEEVAAIDGVETVVTPDMLQNYNEEQTIGFLMAIYDVTSSEFKLSQADELRETFAITEDAGIQTELYSSETEIYNQGPSDMSSEVIGVIVAVVILFFTFGSLLLAGMPVITAIIGLIIGLCGVMIISNYATVAFVAITLAAMLGIAVGIDYGLFIISRFRQEFAKGYSIQQSIAIANGTAGTAVVFAGITVIIALLALAVPQIPFLTMMGISAALTVFIAILIAVIVTPAVLMLFGEKITPAVDRKKTIAERVTDRVKFSGKLLQGWAKVLNKIPVLIATITIAFLAITAIPIFHMELGLPDDGVYEEGTPQRDAYDLLKEGYGEGVHASLVVVVEATEKDGEVLSKLDQLQADILAMDQVDVITNVIPKESGEMAVLTLNPMNGPSDEKTIELVHELRDTKFDGVKLNVTGNTAMYIDISERLSEALPVFASIIVVLAFIIFMVAFRSILVPLKAVLGFVLSLGATLGFVTWVVQDGNFYELFGFVTTSPVLSFLPIIATGILFGLAMDYEVFLVSRMREEFAHSGNARKAVMAGVRDSGGVVVAAALIMVAVFGGFMFSTDPMTKIIGLTLTFGVIFDAFVVRMMMVPAVMMLLGKSAWYMPKWLDRILPNVDMEGEAVLKMVEKEKK